MAITIYGIARTRTARALWMLEELGLPYRHEKVAPAGGGTRTAEFLALNPLGQVPVLDDDGVVVAESLAIALHLARTHGKGGLGPRGSAEEAAMLQWTLFAGASLEPPAHDVLVQTINLPEPQRDAAKLTSALASLERPLAGLNEALLRGGGHLVGGRFTVADLNVACVVWYLRAVPSALDATPAVKAWYDAATSRPAFQRMLALREAG
ncbi:MAG: glutathione S-transferase family protein [Beijerinckiaceae bacterium]